MIVYKIDGQGVNRTNSQLRDIDPILKEIPATLDSLRQLLSQQASTISSPSINNFREELLQLINGTIKMSTALAENTQKLVAVSDQAGKYLSSVEDHSGTALRTQNTKSIDAA